MTLYFQVVFLKKLKYTENTKNATKNAFKCDRKKKVSSLKRSIT